MRYTVRYINAANEVINYLHTDNHLETIIAINELRDKGYGKVWVADVIEEIEVG